MSNQSVPRPEYPRPDFVRESYLCLNGPWSFAFDDEDRGLDERWYDGRSFDRSITVPYVYQSELSGIHEKTFHCVVWYQRCVELPAAEGKRTLLHFGAVDYEAAVWINGHPVGTHRGGSTPFHFDITPWLENGTACITVRVRDDILDLEQPRGKQYWKPESAGIFYTASTGIWQTVWIEQVSADRLERIWITPDVDRKSFNLCAELVGASEKRLRCKIFCKGKLYADDVISVHRNRAERAIWLDQTVTMDWNHQESLTWTPEHPVLFDLELEVLVDGEVTDRVKSYCALRKISVADGKVLLNNRPYYQKLLLDQGYWPQSLLTAPTDEDFVRDIEAVKAMGFNGVRMHQKAEDPRFLYHADRLGLLVWGECASAYVFSRQLVERMLPEWEEIIRRDYNHPCIVCWVPLNESWGVDGIMNNSAEQSFSLTLYHLTKALDQTRPVISNDGWNHTKSDLLTIHDYEAEREKLLKRYNGALETLLASTPGKRTLYAQGFHYDGAPILVSEFGGIAFELDKVDKAWGYSEADCAEDFMLRYEAVVSALLDSPGVQGFCYTQLCDVEQEVNGLLTYDRRFKADPLEIKRINRTENELEETP